MIDENTALKEIIRRRGDTEFDGLYGTTKLEVRDERDGLLVLQCDGWRKYGKRAHRASLAYLCGRDDNGPQRRTERS